MKLLRLDLTKYNQDKLFQIEKEFSLIHGILVTLKSDGVADVWVDPTLSYQVNGVVAWTHKSNRSEIVYQLNEYLLEQKEYTPEKRSKKYDYNRILEKINASGMDSLNKSEKEYLIEYSKSL